MILVSISTLSLSTARLATLEPVFYTLDTSRMPEDHTKDAIPAIIRKTVK